MINNISHEFSKQIVSRLSADELTQLRSETKKLIGSGICHSHQFVDANQIMIDAFKSFGVQIDFEDDNDIQYFNDVWNLSKSNLFEI